MVEGGYQLFVTGCKGLSEFQLVPTNTEGIGIYSWRARTFSFTLQVYVVAVPRYRICRSLLKYSLYDAYFGQSKGTKQTLKLCRL